MKEQISYATIEVTTFTPITQGEKAVGLGIAALFFAAMLGLVAGFYRSARRRENRMRHEIKKEINGHADRSNATAR